MTKAHLVQSDIVWEDAAANHQLVERMLAGAGVSPGDWVVLPEMFNTGFSFDLARTVPMGEASMTWAAKFAAARQVVLFIGITAEKDGKGRNRLLVYSPEGRVIGSYDKMHPFSYGKESDYFSRGEAPVVVDVPLAKGTVKLCPTICYDLRFPELYRAGLALGAEVFVVIANWMRKRAPHARSLSIARAIENQAVVLSVNRVGTDASTSYLGGTMAIDPQGVVVGELDDKPGVLSVEVDVEAVRDWRRDFPAWHDQHPALWRPLQAASGAGCALGS